MGNTSLPPLAGLQMGYGDGCVRGAGTATLTRCRVAESGSRNAALGARRALGTLKAMAAAVCRAGRGQQNPEPRALHATEQ